MKILLQELLLTVTHILCASKLNPVLDNHRVLNASNDIDLTGAPLAGLDIHIEHPLQTLHPGHRRMALGRCF
jgi:hypothetical protein